MINDWMCSSFIKWLIDSLRGERELWGGGRAEEGGEETESFNSTLTKLCLLVYQVEKWMYISVNKAQIQIEHWAITMK